MTKICYTNPFNTKIHHLDPAHNAHDRKCDRAANRYLTDQPRATRKPRRQKHTIRRGLVAIAADEFQGELPQPMLIPRPRN